MTASHRWNGVRNILCVRLDNMGDVLMTTPALRALKTLNPACRITLLASRTGGRLAPFLPDVDDTITYDAAWLKNDAQGNVHDQSVIEHLRSRAFDAAIIFTVYSQSALPAALMCYLAGIPRVLAHCRENPYRLLTDWVRDTEPQQGIRHEVQRQLDLVATIGARPDHDRLSFEIRVADRKAMYGLLREMGIEGSRGWIVAHCGASAPSRRYPAPKFARAFSLLRDCGRHIFLTGSGDERHLAQQVIHQSGEGGNLYNLAGCLTLGQFAALIENAAVLVSNNTGPVHIAAALQTPVVDLYALTNLQHTPWQVRHRLLYHDVPCRNCYRSVCPEGHHACLVNVQPEAVAQAVLELLAAPGAPAGVRGLPEVLNISGDTVNGDTVKGDDTASEGRTRLNGMGSGHAYSGH